MMPSLLNTNVVGVPQHHVSGGSFTVDTMLNEISRQLVGNTRRYSRSSNGQHRLPNAMKICKPGSASNSPKSSTLQSRRRTLIGDGFRGRQQSPAASSAHVPTPASDILGEPLYEPCSRPARPVSWHPSVNYFTQQPFPSQQGSSTTPYAYSTYDEADILASLQNLPPTPAIYSGYTSPVNSSPLSLPYSSFSSQPVYSPPSQPVSTQFEQSRQQQQQAPTSQHSPCASYGPDAAVPDSTYLPASRGPDNRLGWSPYPANDAILSLSAAPPTPEDFACSLVSNGAVTGSDAEPKAQTEQAFQPVIVDDDGGKESDGEILYGMGLYDMPGRSKRAATPHSSLNMLHRSAIFSLLSSRDSGQTGEEEEDEEDEEDEADAGKGLGLKLEDAWEPPVSDDEEEGAEDAD